MVGTGIFVVPPVVLGIVGSKGLALILWLVGGIITWAGYDALSRRLICALLANAFLLRVMVYLEYGFLFPLTGGELHYVSPSFDFDFTAVTYTTRLHTN
jgi:hypothetical protein